MVAASPASTLTALSARRKSYTCTQWSAQPMAISCAEAGLYLTQHTLAFMSICARLSCSFVDQICVCKGQRRVTFVPRNCA